ERPLPPHPVVQVDPLHELHRQTVVPADLAELVDGDDVLVLEAPGVPGFPLEALEHVRPGGHFGQEDLQGDVAVRLGVARAIDRTQAAGGDVLNYLVLAHAHGSPLLICPRVAARTAIPRRMGSRGRIRGHFTLRVLARGDAGLATGLDTPGGLYH